LKAADPRHRPLDSEMIALDPLLQVLGDVMKRILWQKLGASFGQRFFAANDALPQVAAAA